MFLICLHAFVYLEVDMEFLPIQQHTQGERRENEGARELARRQLDDHCNL